MGAGAAVLAIWGRSIVLFERRNNIDRGSDGSELSAMMFGEYYPNPSLYPGNVLLCALHPICI